MIKRMMFPLEVKQNDNKMDIITCNLFITNGIPTIELYDLKIKSVRATFSIKMIKKTSHGNKVIVNKECEEICMSIELI